MQRRKSNKLLPEIRPNNEPYLTHVKRKPKAQYVTASDKTQIMDIYNTDTTHKKRYNATATN